MGLPTGRHYLFLSQQSLVIYSPLSWNETPRDFPLQHKNVYMVVAAVLLMCPAKCAKASLLSLSFSQSHNITQISGPLALTIVLPLLP